jgi:hypothetical protein
MLGTIYSKSTAKILKGLKGICNVRPERHPFVGIRRDTTYPFKFRKVRQFRENRDIKPEDFVTNGTCFDPSRDRTKTQSQAAFITGWLCEPDCHPQDPCHANSRKCMGKVFKEPLDIVHLYPVNDAILFHQPEKFVSVRHIGESTALT